MLNLPIEHIILDVGCGFGQKMSWLVQDGFRVEGVDVNQETINTAKERGFNCMTTDEFKSIDRDYDAMMMAHIIEHFAPGDLLYFMDYYLDRLRTGGYLIVSTPLEHPNFYSDFDHIKTYHPSAIRSAFEQESSQVQYHSRNRLRFIDMALRRRAVRQPIAEIMYSSLHRMDLLWRLSHGGSNRLNGFLFKVSRGSIRGISDGWIGVFQKIDI